MVIEGKLKAWLGEGVMLNVPVDAVHGDYSTNLALTSGKKAADLVAELEQTKPDFIEKLTIAGPGFINFHLKPEFITQAISKIASDLEYGKKKSLLGQKTIFEYTDPNPFKEFHIGHLMSNTIGEALSRLVEATGAEIKRACYQGDVGLHVAKALYGKSHGENDWGKAYVAGSKAYEEKETAKQEIVALNKKVYEKSDSALNELYDEGKKETLAEFEKMYAKLGTKFDYYFFESETGELGKKLVEENLESLPAGRQVFEKSDGAVIFRGEQFGLHTRVFLNSEGLPTYEAKELGLAKIKFDKYAYDQSVIITGNEVNDYFRVLHKALELIFPELAAKTRHIGHGMLRLPSGKMSSRTGVVVTAEALIEEAKEKLKEKTTDPEVQEKVAIAAIKYSILRQAPGRDIVFDFDKSLSFEGDSGPYLQYTRARAHSVLEKAGDTTESFSRNSPLVVVVGEVGMVERKLIHFPEVVARATEEYAPQYLVTYLTELASAFNTYYATHPILDAGDQTPHRLVLTRAVENVLTTGFHLLAIPVLDRM